MILHVINYINLGLFTILDVSINQDSPIAPLEVDREGSELCSCIFGLIQPQSCTLCLYQFCEAQARVRQRQGSGKDGQGLVNKRPLMAPNGLKGLSTLA